jgi:DNA-binding XRE family transcriptional regulator
MKTIRALRTERSWTQFELALKIGVQPQTIYLWESGRRTPLVPQLRRLGQIFAMCSDEIDLVPGSAGTGGRQSTSRTAAVADPAADGHSHS